MKRKKKSQLISISTPFSVKSCVLNDHFIELPHYKSMTCMDTGYDPLSHHIIQYSQGRVNIHTKTYLCLHAVGDCFGKTHIVTQC